MENWSEHQEVHKERKEKDRNRRDKLAGYFFRFVKADLCWADNWSYLTAVFRCKQLDDMACHAVRFNHDHRFGIAR